MIEVTDLTKRYGNHIAVDHLSFKVEKGQIYGFLGPNGAGKSTTMNIITGYLPELPPLYMDMTVKEYLRFAAELKKCPRQSAGSRWNRSWT